MGPAATAYLATAGLILVSSIIENTYFLAYHDELTSLPARRAFNDALLRLEEPYAVAVVDIDHFKSFNDTYGHDTGDQVLRLVAAKLAGVTGGGRAYRVGGEEFSILFPGKSAKEAMPHLELLRIRNRSGHFPRAGRRGAPGHGSRPGSRRIAGLHAGIPETRASKPGFGSGRPGLGVPQSRPAKHRTPRPVAPASSDRERKSSPAVAEAGNQQISVTVSIGAAEPNSPSPLGRTGDSGRRPSLVPGQAVRTQSGRAFICAARGPAPGAISLESGGHHGRACCAPIQLSIWECRTPNGSGPLPTTSS